MESEEQILLRFHGTDIIRTNFFSYKPFIDSTSIKIDVTAKVFYPEDDKRKFKIIMSVSLGVEDFFQLSLDSIGHFEFHADLDKDAGLRRKLVNVNAPAIMFPYVRAFITTLTSNLGQCMKPLTIPTRFFKGELDEFVTEDDMEVPSIEVSNTEDKIKTELEGDT